MAMPFDQAIELHELRVAREAYASRYGEMDDPAYRAAWLRFYKQVISIEDLDRLRPIGARNNRRLAKPLQLDGDPSRLARRAPAVAATA